MSFGDAHRGYPFSVRIALLAVQPESTALGEGLSGPVRAAIGEITAQFTAE